MNESCGESDDRIILKYPHDVNRLMPPSQFLPNRVLLLVFLLVVLPIYSFITGDFAWFFHGLFFGGILFVVKWRWWWVPLCEYMSVDEKQPQDRASP